MLELSSLSQNEKYVIAEFIFGRENNILLKSDGEDVIEMLKKRNVEKASTVDLETNAITELINESISKEDQDAIMKEYFAGDLP